jgi:hypothetical protein
MLQLAYVDNNKQYCRNELSISNNYESIFTCITEHSTDPKFQLSSAAALKNAIPPVRHVNPPNSRVGFVALSRRYRFRNVAHEILKQNSELSVHTKERDWSGGYRRFDTT